MANELEIINNPTSTPSAVSTGYQRQNTRMLAASNGIDNTYVEVIDASTIRLQQSGAVDVSGTLYVVGESEDFTVSSAGRYFIYLADGGDASHKTPTLGTDAGTFDAELNARYLSGGERVLNWLIVKETVGSTKLTVLRMTQPGALAAHNEPLLLSQIVIAAAGTNAFIAPRSQVYTFELQACGGDGGESDTDIYIGIGSITAGGGGGGGGGYIKFSEFVPEGTTITLTKSVASNGNNTITGTGFTGGNAYNGTFGGNGVASAATFAPGDGGSAGAGTSPCILIRGQFGADGASYDDSNSAGTAGSVRLISMVSTMGNSGSDYNGSGGNSFMGFGARGGGGSTGYGSGGSGRNGSPGTSGLFLIWG